MLASLAVLLGTLLDMVVRIIAEQHDLTGLLFMRWIWAAGCLAVPYFLPFYWRKAGKVRPRIGIRGVQFYLFRGFFHTAMGYSFFWGLTQLSLAEATTLGFSGVLLVGPMEVLILREPLRPAAIWATVIGFIGVLVIVAFADSTAIRPDTSPALGRLACGGAAICYALSLVLLRERAQKDDRFTLATYTALAGAFWFLPAYLWVYPDMNVNSFLLAGGLAVVGTGIWYLMGTAYARAPAHVLAPLEYTSFLWAALFGYMVFAEKPSAGLWAGAAIIIAAALLLYADDRRRK